MEFRLTYAGPLYATQRDPMPGKPPKHTENRRHIRRKMHEQLKRLWSLSPALASDRKWHDAILLDSSAEDLRTDIESLAKYHAHYGFNFVPLVTEELNLLCSLDILFLRPDKPGDAIWGGDIDNRLKTFLDALRIPEAGEGYVEFEPAEDEKPFFCLLEDDRLITRISVETDRLLEPIEGEFKATDARVIMTVRIRPHQAHMDNMHLA